MYYLFRYGECTTQLAQEEYVSSNFAMKDQIRQTNGKKPA